MFISSLILVTNYMDIVELLKRNLFTLQISF